ncbi:MAG: peptidoglycan editing factor PgeF [Bacteroidota bacterium]|nr:peptidoglycan editing factor PgeF [Bacteroidota bacterium]
MIDVPEIFKQFANVKAGQSKRTGGFSSKPFYSLNLGLSTNDEAEIIAKNRKLFFEALGADVNYVAHSHQVHDNKILLADYPQHADGYDAIITNKPGLFVCVTVADCTPILIYDHKQKAVAAVHSGWKGTVAKIVTHTLNEMQKQYGTIGADCYAYVGTCISYESFEVGEEVASQFDKKFVRFDEYKQKYFVDLKSDNEQQLKAFGIPPSQIEIAKTCTVINNEEYFSYRKEKGVTGRMLAAIGLIG